MRINKIVKKRKCKGKEKEISFVIDRKDDQSFNDIYLDYSRGIFQQDDYPENDYTGSGDYGHSDALDISFDTSLDMSA